MNLKLCYNFNKFPASQVTGCDLKHNREWQLKKEEGGTVFILEKIFHHIS